MKILPISLAFLSVLALPAAAQTAPAGQAGEVPPGQQPLGPLGVIPLPQGPPPTGLQAPLPVPAQPLPAADRPLLVSPSLSAINHYVESRPITLQDAVAIALYTNRSLATAIAALQRAQARTGQARSAFNPTLGVNANITQYDSATTASFGLPGGSAPPQQIVLLPQFNPIIVTTFSLPIDIAGTLRSAANQAQFNEVAARIDVNRARNQLVYDVKTAFYNALRAQAQVVVATDTLNNALSRLDDANKNFAVGTVPRFDVISAQRDVADAQRGLIDAQSQVTLSLAALKNTIGIDIKTRLRLTDRNAVDYPPGMPPDTIPPLVSPETPAPAAGAAAPAPNVVPQSAASTSLNQAAPSGNALARLPLPPVNEVQDTLDLGPEYDRLGLEALRTRPEILEADAQTTAARLGIQYARRSQLPSLSFSLGYTYTPNAASFTRANQGAATLGVSLPILDSGLARERVREARADVATAEINRRQATDEVLVEVQQAYVNLIQARNRVAVANVGLAQAREAFRLSRVRYNAGVSQQTGVSPQLELSNAQNSLTQAQTNQINALYDYNNARAQLDRAVGRYSYVPSGPGYPSPSSVPKSR